MLPRRLSKGHGRQRDAGQTPSAELSQCSING